MTRTSRIALRSAGAVASVLALATMLFATPADAQGRSRARPMDLNNYSLQFWPHNALKAGQTVRAKTPHGILICKSTGPNNPRQCTLQ